MFLPFDAILSQSVAVVVSATFMPIKCVSFHSITAVLKVCFLIWLTGQTWKGKRKAQSVLIISLDTIHWLCTEAH